MNRQELKNIIDVYAHVIDLTTIEREALHLAKGMLGILDSMRNNTFIDPGVRGAIKQATRPLYEERTER